MVKGCGLTYFANRGWVFERAGVCFRTQVGCRTGVGCRMGAECRMGGGFKQLQVVALVVDGQWLPNNHGRQRWVSFGDGCLLKW